MSEPSKDNVVPIKQKYEPQPPDNRGRKLVATTIGPWQMLRAMLRYAKGESAILLGEELGIGKNTVWRWHRKFSQDLEQAQAALSTGFVREDLEALCEQIAVLRNQINRADAVLQRLMRQRGRTLKRHDGSV